MPFDILKGDDQADSKHTEMWDGDGQGGDKVEDKSMFRAHEPMVTQLDRAMKILSS